MEKKIVCVKSLPCTKFIAWRLLVGFQIGAYLEKGLVPDKILWIVFHALVREESNPAEVQDG